MLTADLADRLAALERQFSAIDPTASRCTVLDSGEVSVVLAHDDLPGLVLKRAGGFPDQQRAKTYADLVTRYCAHLVDRGVPCVHSVAVPVAGPRARAPHAVYVVQPRVPDEELGKVWLADAGDDDIRSVIRQVAAFCLASLPGEQGDRPDASCGIDAQLSNWQVRDGRLVGFLDVTTPLFRAGGRLELDLDVLLRSVPAPVRGYLRRSGKVEAIFAPHFHIPANLVDVLANLHKEGRGDLVSAGVAAANEWCVENGHSATITRESVAAYYQRNAAALELAMRLRRLDARVHRLLRRPYHSVLPLAVERHR